MGDQLSPQDIQDLSAIRAKLSPDDPRAAKIGMLLSQNNPNYQRDQLNLQRNAQPTQFEMQRDPNNQSGFLASYGNEMSNMAKGAAQSVYGNLSNPILSLAKSVSSIPQADSSRVAMGGMQANPMYRTVAAAGQLVGANPTAMEQQGDIGNTKGVLGIAAADATPAVAAAGASALSPAVMARIPSASRAGANFQKASAVVGDNPVDVNAASEPALRASELNNAGMTMPTVLKKFLKRVTDPEAPPMTYDEARDFAKSAGRLSVKQTQATVPEMKMQVAKFAQAMADATQKTADAGGVGDVHAAAMSEYRDAMRVRNAVNFAKKTAIGGSAAISAYYAAKNLAQGREP